jgi:hypothetical protein
MPAKLSEFQPSVSCGQVSFIPPVYIDRTLSPTTSSHPRGPDKMGKGKNHDRKANPGFGKTNGKSASSGGEFTLKRVKGELGSICFASRVTHV